MVEVIVGDYERSSEERYMTSWTPDCVYKTQWDDGPIILTEDLGITKEIIRFVADNATRDVKIVIYSHGLVAGMKSVKGKIQITKNKDSQVNPFELAKSIFTCKDREYLFKYLCEVKPSLVVPIKSMVSNFGKLSAQNRKCVEWLDQHQWKVPPEMLYGYIAKFFQVDSKMNFLTWAFPKKKDETNAKTN